MQIINTTARPVNVFEPATGKGKWHALRRVLRTPRCGATGTAFSDNFLQIPTGTPFDGAHPIVCKKCLVLAGAQGYSPSTV